ncbi:MAG TPA: lysophospholipid acyltransferase family protein [Betaproteobacteria bacterium]|nr:lysophospholipid acyltransferase family protein [Betaproteobacteria bacterium]
MFMLTRLLTLVARLPLRCFHWLGAAVGWGVYGLSPRYAARLRDNLHASGVCHGSACRALRRRAIAEAGKGALELAAVWFRPLPQALKLLRECDGCTHIDAALARGKGIIFLTPHLGCFEITSLYYAANHPITILYRPPKLRWLTPLLSHGRARGRAALAATDLRGVRALLKALKRGEAVGVLPDQAPGAGDGVWAPFFGRPAYTMTLVERLRRASGATVLLAFGERLPRGRGYKLWIEPLALGDAAGASAAATLNAALENMIRRCPEQYLWSYNRYKIPAGAPPPALSPASERARAPE